MSNECDWCGHKPSHIYYEGFDYSGWSEESHTERETPVGKEFCSVRHMVMWLKDKGFEVDANEPSVLRHFGRCDYCGRNHLRVTHYNYDKQDDDSVKSFRICDDCREGGVEADKD